MFDNLTPEYIKSDMLSRLELADTREGSYTNTVVSPVAYEMWKVYTSLGSVLPMVYIDETSGQYIDMKAGEYGIVRKQGSNARASVTFYGDDGTVIPEGKVFLTAEALQYTLDKSVAIAGGIAAGDLTAIETGEEYNVPAGAIFRQLVNLAGITQIESGAATGGADAESDAALAGRYYAYLKMPPTSGNAAHYLHWALEADGVAAAKVIPLWAGKGTVKVLIVGAHNQPVDDAIVTKTAEYIESVRPIGATVTVKSADGYAINVYATVVIRPSVDIAAVSEAFKTALSVYLEVIAFKEYTVVYNRIGYILLDLPGVVDFIGLTVNGGTGDIALSGEDVPVIGLVEVAT